MKFAILKLGDEKQGLYQIWGRPKDNPLIHLFASFNTLKEAKDHLKALQKEVL